MLFAIDGSAECIIVLRVPGDKSSHAGLHPLEMSVVTNPHVCLGGLGKYNGGVWDVDLQKSFVDRALYKNPARAKADLALVQKGRPGWECACQKYRLLLVIKIPSEMEVAPRYNC